MKIDFLGGSYKQKYIEWNPERTINWLPVIAKEEEKDQSKIALFVTPGLSTYSSPSGTNQRGMFTARTHASLTPGKCFTVIDQTLYELNTAGTATSRGTLTDITNDTTSTFMVANANDELGIFHRSAGYVLNMTSNVLTKITDADYPSNVESVAYMDGYVIVSITSGAVYWSSGNDFLAGWSALNVLSPTFKPAETIAVATFNQQLYCFTSETVEVYNNDGTTPFVRLPRTTSEIGLLARESLAQTNDGFIFLGRSSKGEANIYFLDTNYQVKSLANPAITWQLNNTASDLTTTYGSIQYNKEGHLLYFITVPSLSTTHVYDFSTGMWHERNSKNPNDATQGVFRGRYFTSFNGKNLYGDLYGSVIMKEDYSVMTEDGTGSAQAIRRTRISGTFSEENKIISISELEFDLNTGSSNVSFPDAVLQVSYSKNNARTFNTPRNVYVGTAGTYGWRARLPKLGASRKWTVKVVLDDSIDLMIYDLIAHGSAEN